jgi:cysteine desulfuration protein SufE
VAIGWKNALRPLREEERTDANRIQGCVSRVWLVAEMEGRRCHFRMDAESPLVRGLVGMICGIYDGATPDEVVTEEPVVLDETGLLRNLSPTRQNGLAAVRRTLVEFAAKEIAG